MAEFLLEVGCEEIPAGWLEDLEKQFVGALEKALDQEALQPQLMASASTPRRLIAAFNVEPQQKARQVSIFGPSLKLSRDAKGEWTQAALGFARRNNVAPEALEVGVKDPAKPEERSLLFVQHIPGRPAADVLPGVIAQALRALSFPKRMNWDAWLDDGKGAFSFGRPIRWIVALLDGAVVPFTIFEAANGARGGAAVQSGRATRGHRFLGPQTGSPFEVSGWNDLVEKLRQHFVVANRKDRADSINIQREQRAGAVLQGGLAALAKYEQLAREWPDLVEHPALVAGTIPGEFKALPEEVRDTVLVHHQKYFPFTADNGDLRFLAVTDTDAGTDADTDASKAGEIVRGMERVVVARLRDARFFYDEDRKTSMEDAAGRLSGVTFFQGLGNYADKAARMERLVAAMRDQGLLDEVDARLAQRAARLAKADLTTHMVGEFPELQGVMGALYLKAEAQAAGMSSDDEFAKAYDPAFGDLMLGTKADGAVDEAEAREGAVIHAVRWQYESMPPSGPRPRVTLAVALADRLDTLAAQFSIGNVPSGSRDPYGLRRAGSQVVDTLLGYWPGPRSLAQGPWPDLRALARTAVEGVSQTAKRSSTDTIADLESFLTERLRYALIMKGEPIRSFIGERDLTTGAPVESSWVPLPTSDEWTADEVEAVLGARNPDPLSDPRECLIRLRALHGVRQTAPEDFTALAAAFKRINNILKQGKYSAPWEYDRALLTDPAEKELLSRLRDVQQTLLAGRGTKDDTSYYDACLKELAKLRPPVDRFFGDGRTIGAVMVMVEDPKLRRARLGLLGDLVEPFYRVADISKLGGHA